MRRIRYGVAMSLDGFIAGPGGEADWIVMDPDIDFAGMFAQYDTLLMGRRTYEVAGGGDGSGDLSVVVVSGTLQQAEHPRVTLIDADLEARVRALRSRPGKDIWLFGGGDLCRSLLDLDLVDTIEVGVMPVLLGAGVPLVQPLSSKVKLKLTRHVVYPKSGIVGLEYDVVREKRKKRRRREAGA
jgi:dihydrofolate reductase